MGGYKKCFKCGECKPLSAFYRHPHMGDGHLNKCKDCTRRDVQNNRRKNIDHYRSYDRARGNRLTKEQHEKYRQRKPQATKARRKVDYHIRKGDLTPKPCELCGSTEDIHAHHDDYARPLDVRWLCAACHHQWHLINGEGDNARLSTQKEEQC